MQYTIKEVPLCFDNSPARFLLSLINDILDGLTATRSIRQLKKVTSKTIPIIAMSANAFEEDIEKSNEAGMNDHLAKPIEPELLYQALQRYL